MMMRQLYPLFEPYRSFSLSVDERHSLYVEESGNPDGTPFVFLHGGPGAGCEASHRRFFNPDTCRIVLFDQRGCGRSTPHASITDNTTQHLVSDIEAVREHLSIESWVVFGGSWGSTLALAYAQAHPARCLGLILRGVFLCRKRDIQWFYQDGACFLFPDRWEEFIAIIPPNERADMVAAYYKRLTSEDEATRLQAALAWSLWEGKTATLRPSASVIDFFGDPHTALSLARIECHYFVNEIFLRDGQLLDEADKLADIAGVIVQGRYDMACPMEQAYLLHQKWQKATLQIVDDAGHSAFEEGIIHHLVEATDSMAERFANK